MQNELNQNWSLNHLVLSLPPFQDKMTATEHQALFITFSYIIHWCNQKGVCNFPQSALVKDWRIKAQYWANARARLEKHKMIEMVRSYSQKGQHGYSYKLGTGYTPFAKYLYPVLSKAVPPGGRVNNNNNYYRGMNDSLEESSTPIKNNRPNLNPNSNVETKESWEL